MKERDKDARPAIKGRVANMADYDTAVAINPGDAYVYANRAVARADLGLTKPPVK